MTLATARAWLAGHAPDLEISKVKESTATVAEAAAALASSPAGSPERSRPGSGKGSSFWSPAATPGSRPRMLGANEALAVTGHPVGAICPFGLATPVPVYCDVSLQSFDKVFPAAGSLTSSVRVSPEQLFGLVAEEWVDLCR